LTALAQEEGEEEEMAAALDQELAALERDLRSREVTLLLSGEHDAKGALVALHAGTGGTDAQDWTQMLLRMYLRWAERRGFAAQIFELTAGEEAGVKTVTLEIDGPYAYGYLKGERGTHRLVRQSPFDASHARHTSFALVEVLPKPEAEVEVEINADDLQIDTFRASGPGGQNVQKNATAVRITHLPSGLVVSCQNERSLARNRELAMHILQARLLERELQRRAEEQARLKGDHVPASWGTQRRSYVLHPYKLAKDLRTGHETSDVLAVLDGELDEFLERTLRASVTVP